MSAIPPDLNNRLPETLSRCGPFDNAASLRAVFTDARIHPWRDAVPDSTLNRAERIAALIEALHDQANAQGDNALVLFLRVLAEQTAEANACHAEIVQLADDLARALTGSIFICYKRHAAPDNALALALHQALTAAGYQVFIDQTLRTGADWLDEIDRQIMGSDYLIVLLSAASADSEMVQAEIQRAYEYRQQQGHPHVLPVRIAYEGLLPYTIAAFVNRQQYILWQREADTPRVMDELLAVLRGQAPAHAPAQPAPPAAAVVLSEDGRVVREAEPLAPPLPAFDPRALRLRAPGGTMRLSDSLYIRRRADAHLEHEIVGPGTLTTIRAARQTGKSSLLARGIHHARQAAFPLVALDLQQTHAQYLESADSFLRFLAESIALELGLDFAPLAEIWDGPLGPQDKLTRWMQLHVLPAQEPGLILALDEVDRLLDRPFHNDFFALLRAWYNKAATHPVWEKLNLVLVISTEPHLLIQDINQSPFNVGLKLYLEDFTPEQVQALNARHPAPLEARFLPELLTLLGGQPYLTRVALYTLATRQWTWAQLVECAADDRGPFGDHLRHYHWLLRQSPELCAALRQILYHKACGDDLAFFRLLRAGLVKGRGDVCEYRCDLYRRYFAEKL